VIATGANPIKPKLDGIELEHIFTLRSLEDGEAIQHAIQEAKKIRPRPRVVIVGGGYIGLEMAGDLTEVHHIVSGRHAYVPLGSTANKQGRVVGTDIGGGCAPFAGVVGIAVSKVFDLGVAVTGLSELEAAMMDLETNSVIVEAPDRAHYYPGSQLLTVKLLYQPKDGKLLGAQIAGQIKAVNRIDVIASLLHRGGTVDDLSRLDLAYAPPFSPVWDPLLVTANQAL
jgi:CoA-dependent NAD(P)H sulfur oxidoreductase